MAAATDDDDEDEGIASEQQEMLMRYHFQNKIYFTDIRIALKDLVVWKLPGIKYKSKWILSKSKFSSFKHIMYYIYKWCWCLSSSVCLNLLPDTKSVGTNSWFNSILFEEARLHVPY